MTGSPSRLRLIRARAKRMDWTRRQVDGHASTLSEYLDHLRDELVSKDRDASPSVEMESPT
jgi:hypothetical protein